VLVTLCAIEQWRSGGECTDLADELSRPRCSGSSNLIAKSAISSVLPASGPARVIDLHELNTLKCVYFLNYFKIEFV